MAAAKKPATGNEPVRFGVWEIGFRDFKKLAYHYLAEQKISSHRKGNENLGLGLAKLF